MMKILGRGLITILVLSGVIYYIGNYTMIHKDQVMSVQIEHKEETEGKYYIKVNDQKLQVKDESLWNIMDLDTSYDIQYEWYGEKVPYITQIFVHGEGNLSEGGH
ncbi:hypothetical protein ACOJQI_08890 [Bacillus salacetis]|uniref:hypothetical protein n=1 Tax=Bacillus salacetis TaxID=2315464 RepID=UPI003BA10B8B